MRSLWRDLDSLLEFTYSDEHAQALRQRRDWIVPGDWPGSVAWWVADDEAPSVADAIERYDTLDRDGSSPSAFSLREPFDEHGQRVTVTRR